MSEQSQLIDQLTAAIKKLSNTVNESMHIIINSIPYMEETMTITARKRDMIIDWHQHGYSISEIAEPLKISEQEVTDIIKQSEQPADKPDAGTNYDDVPLF